MNFESLTQYQRRLSDFVWDSLPNGIWTTSPGLLSKVDEKGNFKRFIGNTVLFPLNMDICANIAKFTDKIYDNVGEHLAERLPRESYHITLHDLVAGDSYSEDFKKKMESVRDKAFPLTARLRDLPERNIHLQSLATCQLVNTSLVLIFVPIDEQDWYFLQELYGEYQKVVSLSYPLTLHCTLAYLKPGKISALSVEKFRQTLAELNCFKKINICLSMRELSFIEFDSMANYYPPEILR